MRCLNPETEEAVGDEERAIVSWGQGTVPGLTDRKDAVSADYATVFKGVLHITQVALRNLRNTTGHPASKANSGLWVPQPDPFKSSQGGQRQRVSRHIFGRIGLKKKSIESWFKKDDIKIPDPTDPLDRRAKLVA